MNNFTFLQKSPYFKNKGKRSKMICKMTYKTEPSHVIYTFDQYDSEQNLILKARIYIPVKHEYKFEWEYGVFDHKLNTFLFPNELPEWFNALVKKSENATSEKFKIQRFLKEKEEVQ